MRYPEEDRRLGPQSYWVEEFEMMSILVDLSVFSSQTMVGELFTSGVAQPPHSSSPVSSKTGTAIGTPCRRTSWDEAGSPVSVPFLPD